MDCYNSHHRARTVRVAACTMRTTLGDPAANAHAVLDIARECHDECAALAVFPELALTGYSLDDILMQDALLDAVEDELQRITQASVELMPVLVIGAPLRHLHRIYNTAVVIHRGRVLGVAPKSYLPTYREFYELRQMAAGDDICDEIWLGRKITRVQAPFGPDLLFTASDLTGFTLHVEICEDMWIPIPPSAHAALAGATVLTNLSGSPVTIGRAEDRGLLAQSASLRCAAAYIYVSAGEGRIDNRPLVGWPDDDLGKRRVSSPVTTLFNPTETLCCRRRSRPFVLNEATDRHTRRESQTPSLQPT